MSPRPSPRSLLAQAIVGREPILERLQELLDAGATGGKVVALAGDAGLGKTRLVKALLDRARERRHLVLEGRASPLEAALPLGVFQDALRAERRARPATPAPDDPLAAALPGLLLPELVRHLPQGTLRQPAKVVGREDRVEEGGLSDQAVMRTRP